MIQSEHIKREVLQELLESDAETPNSKAIGDHLQQCSSCRKVLEELSAGTDFWNTAPEQLKRNAQSSRFNLSFMSKTEAFGIGQSSSDSHQGIPFSLDGILSPPNHPEMMGRLGKYDVEREIGRGGMGVVLKAHDSELNRPLAIKVLSPHLASHGTARQRFAQEARSAAGVIHPNVIDVYGVCNDEKIPYIVMPYIAGQSLQTLVDSGGPLAEIEITRIALQISAGLSAAHSQGLVHRDIKPANILVEESVNRVVITDFGLARAEDDASLTRTGWLTGTPNYMSPEQTRGQRIDSRSDLFSLGSLMYFLATGRLPFRSESPLGVLNRIQNDQPNPVRSVNNQISRTLQDVIELLHEKDPGKRFQSAGVLHDILERHLSYLHQPEAFQPPRVKPSRFLVKGWKVFAIAASFGLGLIAAASYLPQNFLPETISHSNGNGNSPMVPVLDQNQDDSESKGESKGQKKRQEKKQQKPELKLKKDRKKASELFNQSYGFYQEKNWDKAIAGFEKTSDYQSTRSKSLFNLGCIYALQGKKDNAFRYLNLAVENRYDDYEDYRTDTDLDSLRDDARFKKILADLKTKAKVSRWISRGKSLCGQNQFAAAEKLFRSAIKLDADNSVGLLQLGYAIHMQGKLEEAAKWHMAAAKHEDTRAIANYNLCCVHALKGESEEALAFFGKAIDAGLANQLNIDQIETDPDVGSLKENKEFLFGLKKIRILRKKSQNGHLFFSRGISSSQPMMFHGFSDVKTVEGEWRIDSADDLVDLTLHCPNKEEEWNWHYGKVLSKKDFQIDDLKEEIVLKRNCGRVVLKGKLTNWQGMGAFRFEPDSDFRAKLENDGLKVVSDALLFRFFIEQRDHDDMVKNLKALQKFPLDKETLNALMVEGVKASLVEQYRDENLSVKDHLPFVLRRVRPSLIQEYKKAGLDLKKYHKFISWRVSASLIKQYEEKGFDVFKNKEFVQWRVSPKLLTEYKNANLKPSDFKDYIQHRIGPELITEYQKAGFDLESHKKFLQWRIQPSMLTEYKKNGLDLEKHQRYIQRHVPADLLKSYIKNNLPLDEYGEYAARRVQPEQFVEYKENGLDHGVYFDFLVRRISAERVKSYLDNKLEPHEYLDFLQSQVSVKTLKSYMDAGFDVQRQKTFIRRGVPAKLLKKYQEKGLDLEANRRRILRRIDPEKVRNKN